MKKNVIFFDFFGVICSEIAPIWFERYFPAEKAAQIKHAVCSGGDLGLVSEEEMFSKISEFMSIPAEQIQAEWYGMAVINTELVEYILELKKKHPIYLLSNAIGSFLHRILEKNGLYGLFDRIFISSEMKKAKPDTEYFTSVLRDLGVDAEQAVMIDDNGKNILGARTAGIDGIVFRNNEQLKKELEVYFEAN